MRNLFLVGMKGPLKGRQAQHGCDFGHASVEILWSFYFSSTGLGGFFLSFLSKAVAAAAVKDPNARVAAAMMIQTISNSISVNSSKFNFISRVVVFAGNSICQATPIHDLHI